MWDVIIVGAGPGGSATAKLCAEEGFKTLVLERKNLPREKVCSGVLTGKTVKNLTREIFGEFSEGVLIDPFYLQGAIVRLEGAEPQTIEETTPTAWRKDLDYWMTQKAKEKGAEVFDSTVVLGIEEEKSTCRITAQHKGREQKLSARFVIGADGAGSAVRKALYPGFRVRYKQAIRECYKGSLPTLSRQYLHIFPDPVRRFVFLVNYKGDSFTLEVSAKLGEAKKLRDTVAKPFLAAHYGFDPESEPLWKDGCLEAMLSRDLISGAFVPARGNILLVGDAAGFQLPTAEGIGTALRSASVAVRSLTEGIRQGKAAATVYLKGVKRIIEAIKTLGTQGKYNTAEGPKVTAAAIKERLLGVLEISY